MTVKDMKEILKNKKDDWILIYRFDGNNISIEDIDIIDNNNIYIQKEIIYG